MLPAIISENCEEVALGESNKKLKEACHLRQAEMFTPWLNAAERKIKELKKGYNRKLIKSGT